MKGTSNTIEFVKTLGIAKSHGFLLYIYGISMVIYYHHINGNIILMVSCNISQQTQSNVATRSKAAHVLRATRARSIRRNDVRLKPKIRRAMAGNGNWPKYHMPDININNVCRIYYVYK